MTEPAVAAQTYAQWRATTLGKITERVALVEPLRARLHAPGAAFLVRAADKREFPS